MRKIFTFALILFSYNILLFFIPMLIFLISLSCANESLLDKLPWIYSLFIILSPIAYNYFRISYHKKYFHSLWLVSPNHYEFNWLLPVFIALFAI